MVWLLAAVAIQGVSNGVVRTAVLPADTDVAIDQFNYPHSIFIDAKAKPRNQLLIFLPGTNGRTTNTNAFCITAAELGYHVINLQYPVDVPATIVRNDRDRNAFLNFRLEIIEGGDKSKLIEVSRANSIENRLIKLLEHLDKKHPSEGWSQFLDGANVKWSSVAVSGLSQGAGHAGLIAARHKVARAVLFGGPKDYDRAAKKPAAWYSPSATSPKLIFTFNHEQDKQGCDLAEQLEICKAMGLEEFGKAVNVDSEPAPYKKSRILTTNYPGTPVPSVRAHGTVIGDGASPNKPDGSKLFKPVWVYMLTEGS